VNIFPGQDIEAGREEVAQKVFGSFACDEIRVSRRTTCLVFGTRGEKDIEGNTVVSFDFEKFNADRVLLYPLDRSEPHLHWWLFPRKIQHKRELLAALKEVIDPQPGTFAGQIEQSSVLRVLRQQRYDRGLACDGESPPVATV
jgi:hypothetical protein